MRVLTALGDLLGERADLVLSIPDHVTFADGDRGLVIFADVVDGAAELVGQGERAAGLRAIELDLNLRGN